MPTDDQPVRVPDITYGLKRKYSWGDFWSASLDEAFQAVEGLAIVGAESASLFGQRNPSPSKVYELDYWEKHGKAYDAREDESLNWPWGRIDEYDTQLDNAHSPQNARYLANRFKDREENRKVLHSKGLMGTGVHLVNSILFDPVTYAPLGLLVKGGKHLYRLGSGVTKEVRRVGLLDNVHLADELADLGIATTRAGGVGLKGAAGRILGKELPEAYPLPWGSATSMSRAEMVNAVLETSYISSYRYRFGTTFAGTTAAGLGFITGYEGLRYAVDPAHTKEDVKHGLVLGAAIAPVFGLAHGALGTKLTNRLDNQLRRAIERPEPQQVRAVLPSPEELAEMPLGERLHLLEMNPNDANQLAGMWNEKVIQVVTADSPSTNMANPHSVTLRKVSQALTPGRVSTVGETYGRSSDATHVVETIQARYLEPISGALDGVSKIRTNVRKHHRVPEDTFDDLVRVYVDTGKTTSPIFTGVGDEVIEAVTKAGELLNPTIRKMGKDAHEVGLIGAPRDHHFPHTIDPVRAKDTASLDRLEARVTEWFQTETFVEKEIARGVERSAPMTKAEAEVAAKEVRKVYEERFNRNEERLDRSDIRLIFGEEGTARHVELPETVSLVGSARDRMIDIPWEYKRDILKPSLEDVLYRYTSGIGGQIQLAKLGNVDNAIAKKIQEYTLRLDAADLSNPETVRGLALELDVLEARGVASLEDHTLPLIGRVDELPAVLDKHTTAVEKLAQKESSLETTKSEIAEEIVNVRSVKRELREIPGSAAEPSPAITRSEETISSRLSEIDSELNVIEASADRLPSKIQSQSRKVDQLEKRYNKDIYEIDRAIERTEARFEKEVARLESEGKPIKLNALVIEQDKILKRLDTLRKQVNKKRDTLISRSEKLRREAADLHRVSDAQQAQEIRRGISTPGEAAVHARGELAELTTLRSSEQEVVEGVRKELSSLNREYIFEKSRTPAESTPALEKISGRVSVLENELKSKSSEISTWLRGESKLKRKIRSLERAVEKGTALKSSTLRTRANRKLDEADNLNKKAKDLGENRAPIEKTGEVVALRQRLTEIEDLLEPSTAIGFDRWATNILKRSREALKELSGKRNKITNGEMGEEYYLAQRRFKRERNQARKELGVLRQEELTARQTIRDLSRESFVLGEELGIAQGRRGATLTESERLAVERLTELRAKRGQLRDEIPELRSEARATEKEIQEVRKGLGLEEQGSSRGSGLANRANRVRQETAVRSASLGLQKKGKDYRAVSGAARKAKRELEDAGKDEAYVQKRLNKIGVQRDSVLGLTFENASRWEQGINYATRTASLMAISKALFASLQDIPYQLIRGGLVTTLQVAGEKVTRPLLGVFKNMSADMQAKVVSIFEKDVNQGSNRINMMFGLEGTAGAPARHTAAGKFARGKQQVKKGYFAATLLRYWTPGMKEWAYEAAVHDVISFGKKAYHGKKLNPLDIKFLNTAGLSEAEAGAIYEQWLLHSNGNRGWAGVYRTDKVPGQGRAGWDQTLSDKLDVAASVHTRFTVRTPHPSNLPTRIHEKSVVGYFARMWTTLRSFALESSAYTGELTQQAALGLRRKSPMTLARPAAALTASYVMADFQYQLIKEYYGPQLAQWRNRHVLTGLSTWIGEILIHFADEDMPRWKDRTAGELVGHVLDTPGLKALSRIFTKGINAFSPQGDSDDMRKFLRAVGGDAPLISPFITETSDFVSEIFGIPKTNTPSSGIDREIDLDGLFDRQSD